MDKITKAVIPCGGMGTRFLPITKAVPKEILPIVDTPVLSYIVDEAVGSGVSDVLIILGNAKQSIKDYFTPNAELEDKLCAAGKTEYVELLKKIYSKANIHFAYQDKPLGSAHAVYQAKAFTGDEAFCLAWGDDLIINEGGQPVMGQLMDGYYKYGVPILGVQYFPSDDIVKYGVAKVSESEGRAHKCVSIVEKPALKDIPSRYASLGRYVLDKRVYDAIDCTPTGKGGEYQLTDTLEIMCSTPGVYAYEFEGKRYDMGDKFGALTATVEFSLKNPEYGKKFADYIKNLANKL